MTHLPHRKRIRLSRDSYAQGDAFSTTIATAGRHPWFRLHTDLADACVRVLVDLAVDRRAALYAWCVMPDHVHLLLWDRGVTDFVRLLKGKMVPAGRRREAGRTMWQRSYYDHGVRKEESLEDIAVYIWQNPVRVGLVESGSDYPWSGSLVWPDWREWLQRAGRG